MLQQLEIPEWKWDNIVMDFVTHCENSWCYLGYSRLSN